MGVVVLLVVGLAVVGEFEVFSDTFGESETLKNKIRKFII